jgi:hypothetical protein
MLLFLRLIGTPSMPRAALLFRLPNLSIIRRQPQELNMPTYCCRRRLRHRARPFLWKREARCLGRS